MTTRSEIDAAIAAGREAFERLRRGTSPPSQQVAVAIAAEHVAKSEPAAPAPPAPDRDLKKFSDRPNRAVPNIRPPAHYLAGPREEWRDFISADGVIAPGAGRGTFWGPI